MYSRDYTILLLTAIALCACMPFIAAADTGDGKPVEVHDVAKNSKLLYGAAPVTVADFEEIARHGASLVISVDGAKPKLDEAKAAGLQYVHVPIGYDDVPIEAQAALSKAVRGANGKVYIHCHHGKHRAPAAAAIAYMSVEHADHDGGHDVLVRAGTGEQYKGLWKAIESFTPVAIAAMDPELKETADISPLTEQMAILDRHWDRIKAFEEVAWTGEKETIAHEALMASEALHEFMREALERDYAEEAIAAADAAKRMYKAIQRRDSRTADEAFANLKKSCSTCHTKYRN